MEATWSLAALWMALALLAVLIGHRLRLTVALVEIVVGAVAQYLLVRYGLLEGLAAQTPWIAFLASAGAVVLTFLAGSEIDTKVLRARWKEAFGIGAASFVGPFLGCAALAKWGLGWSTPSSWLAGVALSTTSMAVVYAVMLDSGLNKTEFGKVLLAACFITDLGTVIALGLLFAPFSPKTWIFTGVTIAVCVAARRLGANLFWRLRRRAAEVETKFILLVLFALGALAASAGSEAVLPAYLIGIALARSVGRNHQYLKRLRTLTMGLLTPFYFLRAGSLVSVPALAAAPLAILALFAGKVAAKFALVWPSTKAFKYPRREAMYTTLMMSTGLTFGTISSLYGLSHGIITPEQYSFLVAAVIGTAVIPTMIAEFAFRPRPAGPETS